jgi:hypothetical protein
LNVLLEVLLARNFGCRVFDWNNFLALFVYKTPHAALKGFMTILDWR